MSLWHEFIVNNMSLKVQWSPSTSHDVIWCIRMYPCCHPFSPLPLTNCHRRLITQEFYRFLWDLPLWTTVSTSDMHDWIWTITKQEFLKATIFICHRIFCIDWHLAYLYLSITRCVIIVKLNIECLGYLYCNNNC